MVILSKKNDLEDTFFLLGGIHGAGEPGKELDKFNPDTNYLINQIEQKKLIKNLI